MVSYIWESGIGHYMHILRVLQSGPICTSLLIHTYGNLSIGKIHVF